MITLIFDFDGTIADTLEAAVQAFNKATNHSGPLGRDDLALLHNLSTREIIKKLRISALKLPLLLKKIRSNMGHEIASFAPYSGIKEMLQQLTERNITLGILTSNTLENVHKYLQHYNLDYFNFIDSELALFKKARALKKLLKKHNITPDDAIYIGDETRDIVAAKKCGIRSAAVTWGLHSHALLEKYQPDYIISQPAQILTIL